VTIDGKSTTLYFGPWYRRSPFFEASLRAGCTAFDIYNHMYLPAYYDDVVVEYWALSNGVTMWDVGVERTIEISGPDADILVDRLTCRDLSNCDVMQGKYMLITAPDGGIVNDPVLLHVGRRRWWMQLADSDAGLYALGVAAAGAFDVEVTEPDVHPLQVQGPQAAVTLARLVGEAIYDLRYYWCGFFDIGEIPVLISRTGWTAIPGFEVNLLDKRLGTELWEAIAEAGQEFSIRPIAPSEPRRIEAGIFNYGSDITLNDTPFHAMGLERLVEHQTQDYIGKAALESLRTTGVRRKLVGVELDGEPLAVESTRFWRVLQNGAEVGHLTGAVWSPGLAKNIGYVWVPIELAAPGNVLEIETEDGVTVPGLTSRIPFVDPQKQRPTGRLHGGGLSGR